MDEQNYETRINLTSLVDVALTLVIIFMMTAPFTMQNKIAVSSSKLGAAKGETALTENVNVTLTQEGKIKVNGKDVPEAQFPAVVKTAISKSKNRMVILLASPKNNIRQVVDILDCSKQQGAQKVALLKR